MRKEVNVFEYLILVYICMKLLTAAKRQLPETCIIRKCIDKDVYFDQNFYSSPDWWVKCNLLLSFLKYFKGTACQVVLSTCRYGKRYFANNTWETMRIIRLEIENRRSGVFSNLFL